MQNEAATLTTLARAAEAELEEKKSIFLSHAAPVSDEAEAQAFIKQKKAEFADARHNVWAYRIAGDIAVRCSDDGEPQGSSGIPTLDVLRKSGVSNAVIVTTRYFGGILLGAGGLVRAYSAAARLAVEAAGIVTYSQYTELRLICSYANYQRYLVLLPKLGALIDGTDFADTVTVRFAVPAEAVEGLCRTIREMSNGAELPEVTGSRFDGATAR